MRLAVALAVGLGFAAAGFLASPASAEYYCSEGFAPTYDGQCVATASRDQINLYLNEPAAPAYSPPLRHRRHHRRPILTERY